MMIGSLLFLIITSNALAMPPVVSTQQFPNQSLCLQYADKIRTLVTDEARAAKSTITVSCI